MKIERLVRQVHSCQCAGSFSKAGTTDAKKVMETIKAGKWDTVLGPIEIDAKGDLKQIDYVVYKWDAKGNYSELGAKGS